MNGVFVDPYLKERRERIATAAMQGLLAAPITNFCDGTVEGFAKLAIRFTDALIAELDKPKEEDKT